MSAMVIMVCGGLLDAVLDVIIASRCSFQVGVHFIHVSEDAVVWFVKLEMRRKR